MDGIRLDNLSLPELLELMKMIIEEIYLRMMQQAE